MLRPEDQRWLHEVLPSILRIPPSGAAVLVDICRGWAVNPFTPVEELFNERNHRAKFWAELGRRVGEHLDREWSEGSITLEEAEHCANLLSGYLIAERPSSSCRSALEPPEGAAPKGSGGGPPESAFQTPQTAVP